MFGSSCEYRIDSYGLQYNSKYNFITYNNEVGICNKNVDKFWHRSNNDPVLIIVSHLIWVIKKKCLLTMFWNDFKMTL